MTDDEWRLAAPWPGCLAYVAHRAVGRAAALPSQRVAVTTDRWLPSAVGTWHLIGDPALAEGRALALRDDQDTGLPLLSGLRIPPFDVLRPGTVYPGLRHTEFRFRLRVHDWFGHALDVTFTFRDGRVAGIDTGPESDLLFDTTFDQLVAVHVGAASWRDAFSRGTKYVGKQAAVMFGIGLVEQLPRNVVPPARAGLLVDVSNALGRPARLVGALDSLDPDALPHPRRAEVATVHHATGPTAVVTVQAGERLVRGTSPDVAAALAWARAVAGDDVVEVSRSPG